MAKFPDTSIEHAAQKALDKADVTPAAYCCKQCGEPCYEDDTHSCFYCETRYCPKCRKRDSCPVTDETVDVCMKCAEKLQEIWDAIRLANRQEAKT